ncbi:sensor histidine kinase [Microbacterium sp. NPDC008134]|uniref:sensor histidine kinase n=1 Tax=Microbacterium sp. NPDC008134 TaxID=3364183 RepID=UPI0036E5FDD7
MSEFTDVPEAPADPRPRMPRWLPDVLVSIVVLVFALAPTPIPDFRPTSALSLVLVLLPLAILPWRRRWPILTLVALLMNFGAAAATGILSPGIGIAIGLAMYQVTLRSTRRRALVLAACAVVAVMLLSLLSAIGSVYDPRAFQFGLIVALSTALGDAARSRRDYIAAITERAERAVRSRESEAQRRVSEERLRIARDLHDAVAHQIAVISLQAGVATSVIDDRPDRAKQALATIRGAARIVLGEIGDLMSMLRTADDGEQASVPLAGMDRIDDLVAQFAASGLEVTMRREGDVERVTGATGFVAYRVVQEALTNAHKHGAEHRAHLLLHADDDELMISVTNPMAMPPARDVDDSSGLGLVGLRERVASVRGTVDAGPDGGGWKIHAWMPRSKDQS